MALRTKEQEMEQRNMELLRTMAQRSSVRDSTMGQSGTSDLNWKARRAFARASAGGQPAVQSPPPVMLAMAMDCLASKQGPSSA